jgi:hypothetical protein
LEYRHERGISSRCRSLICTDYVPAVQTSSQSIFFSHLKALSSTIFDNFTSSQKSQHVLRWSCCYRYHTRLSWNTVVPPRCAHERRFARTSLLPPHAFCADARHSSHERCAYGLWRWVWRRIWWICDLPTFLSSSTCRYPFVGTEESKAQASSWS